MKIHTQALPTPIGGTFVEAHELDAPTARKVSRKMIGRVLTAREAATLLDRLG
jgi:hypothetical protein